MQARTFRYKNPIYIHAIDAIRDCQITEVDGTYYLTGTGPPVWGEGPKPGAKLFSSPDGRDWIVCHYQETGKGESLGFDPVWIEDGVIKTDGPTWTEQTIDI